ncbi:MAG: SDR family oxidoreductase [Flavobacteriaceae bacterium]|nr:SDR family oxidoreductase [Flavobacteriaceae bacterium]
MSDSNKSMTNKICVISGATSGIGKETAKALALKGAHVVVVGRNMKRCARTVKTIKKKTGNTNVDYLCADLSDLSQVRDLAKQLKQDYPRIDVLINNAGAFYDPRLETADGYEMTLALNYLSPFLLTTLLIDSLKASEQGRIVNVASSSHYVGKINFEDIQYTKNYHAIPVYAQSKLALVLFTKELAERLKDTKITVNTLCPGLVATNFRKNNGWLRFYVRKFVKKELTAVEGSQTMIYLATSPEVAGITGDYFEKEKQKKSSDLSYDKELAKKLWEVGEPMIKEFMTDS